MSKNRIITCVVIAAVCFGALVFFLSERRPAQDYINAVEALRISGDETGFVIVGDDTLQAVSELRNKDCAAEYKKIRWWRSFSRKSGRPVVSVFILCEKPAEENDLQGIKLFLRSDINGSIHITGYSGTRGHGFPFRINTTKAGR